MKNYSSTEPLYLDHNSTTPVDALVLEQMLPWFSRHFGNASSSLHAFGWRAAEVVKIAREQTAALIGAEPGEIYFTSGATESLNLAIKGLFETSAAERRQILSYPTEHRAVLDTLRYLEKKGAEIIMAGVNEQGLPDTEALRNATGRQTLAVVAMLANNETGVLFPAGEIGAIAREAGAVYICDATQACGKVHVNVQEIQADLLALSAHKFYGPKGIGALFVRRKNPRIRLNPQVHGGGHENGIRSGTLNVPGIVGLGAAAELAAKGPGRYLSVQAERNALENFLLQSGAVVNGSGAHVLPNTINFRFPGLDAARLIAALPELALSNGSACSSASGEPSHVLLAMGLDPEACRQSIRISLGRDANIVETKYISGKISDALRKLSMQG